jgi:hypothetical protein
MPFRYLLTRRKSSKSIGVSATGGGEAAALERAACNIVTVGNRHATTARRRTQNRSTTVDPLALPGGLPTISTCSVSSASHAVAQ